MVGQENVMFAGFLIPIADAAQGQGFFTIGDLNDVVGGYTRCPVRAVALNDPETCVDVEPRDQDDVGFTFHHPGVKLPDPGSMSGALFLLLQ